MPQSQAGDGAQQGRAKWLALALLGVFVVVAGIRLPQMLSQPIKRPTGTPAKASEPEKKEYKKPQLPDGPDASAMLMRLGIGTAIVLVLIVVTLFLGKRWLAPLAPARNENHQMQLVESLTLENRCRLHLVKVGGRELLIGIDGSGVKTVTPLEEPLNDQFQADLSEGSNMNDNARFEVGGGTDQNSPTVSAGGLR